MEQQSVLEQLRGDPSTRPTVDPEFRLELREALRDAVPAVNEPLQVSKDMLNKVHACEGRFVHDRRDPPNLPMAKGMLAHRLIQKTIEGEGKVSPQRAAEAQVKLCAHSDKPIGDVIRSLQPEQRQQLIDELVDFHVSYTTMFPYIPKTWAASEVSTGSRVDSKVTLSGRIDMKLGERATGRASTILIDFKTGRPGNSDRDDLRFYSLCETLGNGGQPYRFANVYLKTATYEAEDVTENTLWSAARRTTDGITKIHELGAGRPAELTPGSACRFCTVNDTCPVAFRPEAAHGDDADVSDEETY